MSPTTSSATPPSVSPDATRIGWIGTGVMGASMAGHLLDAGYALTVNNRTQSRADDLVSRGAVWADTPREAATDADIVFTIVGYPADVREVVLGDTGVLAGAKAGAVIVDMTTSEPSLAIEVAAAAAAQGATAIDAPVSGGDVGARNGTLSIMIGGDADAVAALQPCWEAMGSTIVHQGPAGAGQHTKMVNQTIIASGMVGVTEGLLYAHQAGLDITTVLESVSSGAAGSWSLSNLAPRVVAGNFDPGFYVEHFIKDMGIALAEAKAMNLKLPGLSLAHELYERLQAAGGGRNGTQALMLALAEMSGITWPQGEQ